MAAFLQNSSKKSMDKRLVRITTVPLSLDKLLDGQLRFMSDFYDVTAISSEETYLEKIGKKEGVPVFHLEMTRKITPLKDISAVWQLYRFLKKSKPFIVHTHTPKAGIVGMLAAKLAGVPHRLHTVAGLPLLETAGAKRKMLDSVEKMTYWCATKVYPNSYGLMEIIKKNGYCPAAKLKVLASGSSNGIDTKRFSTEEFSAEQKMELRTSLGIDEHDFVFVFVGRLVGDKGINELVCAFDGLSNEKKNVKLLLVGPSENHLDPLTPATLQTIKNNESIIQAGYQSDVRPYFAISDVLAFPSYREGFPNVVMQAGAMGLPCIVTNINGCNEIISDRENGLIIPVKNIAALGDAMRKCLNDRALFEQMRNQARPRIVNRYEQRKVWEAILAEYRTFGTEN
jgi:glycosyltransferase involved in cell wall biosynthesis